MLPSLTSQCIARPRLSDVQSNAMYELFEAHFSGASVVQFQRDLHNKDWVILLSDQDGAVQGFSTFALYQTQHAGRMISVVCSGDTIVRPAFWGTPELPRSWIQNVLRLSADMPKPLYWLLISSGYKTYRFLSVFYRMFYPRYDVDTPADARALMAALAEQRFGADYCVQTGIVRFKTGATALRDGIATPTDERLSDPHVRFFIDNNPGHNDGDELVCLTRVDRDNFTAAGRRMART
jgi:hypothetical protein